MRWKGISVVAVFLVATLTAVHAGDSGKNVSPDCTWHGKKLYGKVQFVDSFPDIKVKAVTAFPDLKVKPVEAFPDHCGEWQVVDAFPDLRIQFVTAFPDVTIKFVEAFPGLP
jgi:hypothetical protein